MKVLFDSTVMALALLENIAMHKTGIYRYADNLASHLQQLPDVELAFYSMLDRKERARWKDRIDQSEALKEIPLLNHYHPLKNRMDHAKARLGDAKAFKKILLKSLCESYRLLMSSSSYLMGNVGSQDIYYSPYHPLPKRVRAKKDLNCFVTIHDLIPLKYPHFFKVDKRSFFDSIFKKARPNDFFIAASESTKADICHYYGINPSKITVAYGAPQRDVFYPIQDENKKNEVLKRYGIDRPYLLSVATVEPRKNIEALVEAYFQILKEKPNFEYDLVLCGPKGWGVDHLRDKVKEFQHRVIITGFVSDNDLASIYSGATAFVYPSLYEGFGIPVVEAMCCNTPVIVSDRSSLPEVAQDAALYIDPQNIDDISAQILKLTENEDIQKVLREKGQAQVEKFGWDKTAQTIYDAFQESLQQVS